MKHLSLRLLRGIGMFAQESRHRAFLMLVVLGQVSFVPIVIFGLTSFIETGWTEGSPYLLFRWDLIPWICWTGLFYGVISLILATSMSGWMPTTVALRGGWLASMGIRGRSRDSRRVDRSSTELSMSPFGQLATITSRQRDRFDLIFIHGGLQTLAIPIQAILIALPILSIEYLPEELFREGSTLELVSLVYLASLWIGLRIQVAYSDKLVVPATVMRRFLGRTAQLSWVLPVIVYWFVARLILIFFLGVMGIDLTDQTIEFDILILEEILPIEQGADGTPLVDLIVAMGVLPVATFTTISVLAGGYEIPEWMDPSKMVGNMRDELLPEGVSDDFSYPEKGP